MLLFIFFVVSVYREESSFIFSIISFVNVGTSMPLVQVSPRKGSSNEVIMVDPLEAKRLAAKQMQQIKAKEKFKVWLNFLLLRLIDNQKMDFEVNIFVTIFLKSSPSFCCWSLEKHYSSLSFHSWMFNLISTIWSSHCHTFNFNMTTLVQFWWTTKFYDELSVVIKVINIVFGPRDNVKLKQ